MKSRYIEPTEVEAVRAVMSEDAFLPLWLSLETGLRVGDVVALRVSAVKPDGIHYKAKKTNKRGIATISEALRKRLPTRGRWLFPSRYKADKHITRQAVWARIKTAGEKAGVDVAGLSPHTFRKVFAVELYREKGFRAAQQALQHVNTATTEIYAYADWSTGANADRPLKRRDLELIIKMCIEALGDNYTLPPEQNVNRKKGK